MAHRSASAPRVIVFTPADVLAVVSEMERMTAAQRGWINLRPDVDDEDAGPKGGAVRAGIFKVFSGLGPAVPLCTWVAPAPKQKPPHAEIGMLHRAGPKVVDTLAAATCGVPESWVVLGDHPKRGLVVAIPPGTTDREVLGWLLAAARVVARVPIPDRWQATIHEP